MGAVLPLPLSEIKAYMEIFEVSEPDDRATFIRMVQALDSVYVTNMNDRLRREKERKGKGK